jgi:drug/metabolite transporter (DMT)-like permease
VTVPLANGAESSRSQRVTPGEPARFQGVVDLEAEGGERPVRAYLWMLFAAVSFSTMGGLAHAAGNSFDWQMIAFARALIPLVLTVAWGLAEGAPLLVWKPWSLWVRSLAGSSALLSAFYCFTRLPVGDVLTLTHLFPVWLALLSWPVLGQKPTWSTWLAIAVGMSGVFLVQQPHLERGNLATLVAVFSSFCSSVAMLGLHQLKGISPRAVVMHFSAVSLVFCAVAWGLAPTAGWKPGASLPVGLTLLAGIGGTATLGQLALTKAFTSGVPSQVALIGLSQVAFGMLMDVTLFDRHFTAPTLIGTALVLAPTAWLMTRRPRPVDEIRRDAT